MKEIRDANEKAEKYLYKIVDESKDNFIDVEKNKYIPEGWPIQFEAYAYLGHKYKSLIPDYAKKIRQLWLNWAKWYENKEHKCGKYKFFWPAIGEFSIPIDHENAESDTGYEIECHIAMFRAKEVLKIIGFDSYFDQAKKRLASLLIKDDIFVDNNNRILWQIVRSPNLCMLLQDYLKTAADRLLEKINVDAISEYERGSFLYHVDLLAKASFLLILSNLKEEYFKVGIKILLRLADRQENDGAFFNDILSTCLIISAMHIANVDSSKTIINQALVWLLKNQTAQGNWNAWHLSWSYDLPELDVLSTVLVLETIDLITHIEPLPIWAESFFPKEKTRESKKKLIQIVAPLTLDKTLKWGDIRISFISDEEVEIRTLEPMGKKNFMQLGFEDRRSNKPDLIWETLKEFAKNEGSIRWQSGGLPLRISKNLKSYTKTLRIRLKALFPIDDDPFFPYSKINGYRTKFSIICRDKILD